MNTNTMTPEQLREFDAWIDATVFKQNTTFERLPPPEYYELITDVGRTCPHYTTSPADAMAVLEKIAEKTSITIELAESDKGVKHWRIHAGNIDEAVYAKTLSLVICLFARKLFEKGKS